MPLATSGFNRAFRVGARPLVITSVSQLPNLEVDYDASDGSTNAARFNNAALASGTEVSAWHNAGNLSSHDWNSTGGKRPEFFSPIQNSKGVVRFNNTTSGVPTGEDADVDEYLSVNPISYLQSLAGCTMFIVFRSLSTAAGTRICTTTNTNGFKWGQTGTQWIGGVAGATFTVDTITADTNFHHISLIYDGSQADNASRFKARLDAIPLSLTFTGTVGTTTNASANTFYGGCDSNGSSNYWIGDIGELMIFTRALTSSEVFAVEEYISVKWAI